MQMVHAKLKDEKKFYQKSCPIFFFHNKFTTHLRPCESYIYFIQKILKKVNALGKISVHTDDKLGYFLSGLIMFRRLLLMDGPKYS